MEVPPPIQAAKVVRSGRRAKDVKVEFDEGREKENEITLAEVQPKKKRKSVKREQMEAQEENIKLMEEAPVTPSGKRRRAATKPAIIEEDQDDLDDSKSLSPVPDECSEAGSSLSNAGEEELDSDGEPVRRGKNGRKIAKRKKKTKEPIVYVIPEVPSRDFRTEGPLESREERKEGFKGRLGYACLNTVLRNQDPPVFCSRNVRIKTIEEKGLDWVKDLARQNVKDIVSGD